MDCRTKDDIIRVRDYIPDIRVDLKYATPDNFTGKVIYDFKEAYLRYGTVMKLSDAQACARRDGYTLVIWDAFRPLKAQFALWEACPDPAYVADPYKGWSKHSCGSAVDLTLAATDGTKIPMPTQFDDFSPKADRDYSDCSAQEAANARYLERIMSDSGFGAYEAEWWHFNDTDRYDPAEKESQISL